MISWLKSILSRASSLPRSGMMRVDASTGEATPVEETDGGRLYATLARPRCPDCGQTDGFWSGPSGGISTNVHCPNKECRSAFNVTPMVGTAERIGKAPDGIYE